MAYQKLCRRQRTSKKGCSMILDDAVLKVIILAIANTSQF